MQILLSVGDCTHCRHQMSDQLTDAVHEALCRFGPRVKRVEAHLSGADGRARTSARDIHCTLRASLVDADVVVVKDQARSVDRAMQGALRKLKRAVGAAVARRDPRRPSQPLASRGSETLEPVLV